MLLWPSIRDPTSVTSLTISQEDYVDVMYDLADENDLCFLDMYSTLGSSYGFANETLKVLYDGVHLNTKGHDWLHRFLFDLFTGG